MKVAARDIAATVNAPHQTARGYLIYGQDAMRVSLRRKALVENLVGDNSEEEMRFTRLNAADLRKDKAAVTDALKAVGFFPGPRVVLVEDVKETVADIILSSLDDWQNGDAVLVLAAGTLRPTSKIRKAFETEKDCFALAIYDDPPSRAEVAGMMSKAGVPSPQLDAEKMIDGFARNLDPGDFAQLLEKLALYTMGQDQVTVDDIEAVAPASSEAAVDDLLNAVAEANTSDLSILFSRITAQGIAPTGLCIQALRHFRSIHTVASHPGGVSQGIAKLRPPVYGPRRDRLQRQANAWGVAKSERAVGVLLETDLTLRSAGQTAPQMALVERSLIRLAMMGAR